MQIRRSGTKFNQRNTFCGTCFSSLQVSDATIADSRHHRRSSWPMRTWLLHFLKSVACFAIIIAVVHHHAVPHQPLLSGQHHVNASSVSTKQTSSSDDGSSSTTTTTNDEPTAVQKKASRRENGETAKIRMEERLKKQFREKSGVFEEEPHRDQEFEDRKSRAFSKMNLVQKEKPSCVYPKFDEKKTGWHFFDIENYKISSERRKLTAQIALEESEAESATIDEGFELYLQRAGNQSNTTLLRRRLDRAGTKPVSHKGKMAFIHIGKTAGTTVSKFLLEAQRVYYANNKEEFRFRDSAISRQVDLVVHDHNLAEINAKQTPTHSRFLITVRHPVHRMQSWFDYEHHWENKFCGKAMVYTCYDTFDQLATEGLTGSRPRPSIYRLSMNLTKSQCRHWAWGAIQGKAASNAHNFWNYEKYTRSIFPIKDRQMYVIRQEYVWDDWKNIDWMVGGRGDMPTTDGEEVEFNKMKRTKKFLSEVGRRNVCRALCDEIQVYKQLIDEAVNLKDEEKRQSLRELQIECPEETSLEVRSCSYD